MATGPLQNRVQPDGTIVATPQRGLFFGNRGGRIHNPLTRRLLANKRWATKQWICCVLDFKNRQRSVMGPGYTELFFVDEVTALAAGHRPCFECRRDDATQFALMFGDDNERTRAPHMDKALHRQRLHGRLKNTDRDKWGALPIGSMVLLKDKSVAKSGQGALAWSFDGYRPLSSSEMPANNDAVNCLTPPAIRQVLSRGYQPHWHPSAFAD